MKFMSLKVLSSPFSAKNYGAYCHRHLHCHYLPYDNVTSSPVYSKSEHYFIHGKLHLIYTSQ